MKIKVKATTGPQYIASTPSPKAVYTVTKAFSSGCPIRPGQHVVFRDRSDEPSFLGGEASVDVDQVSSVDHIPSEDRYFQRPGGQ